MTQKAQTISNSKATTSTANLICAPATAAGTRSAIALVRASGGRDGRLFAAVSALFQSRSGKPLTQLSPRQAHYGTFGTPGAPIDDVLLTRFDAPASFTGEDSLEISCHGNPIIIRSILEALHASGVRYAEPGEFTRRAYLNGKLGLDAAQAIGEIIEARSHLSLKAAQRLQQGSFRREMLLLRSELMNLLADLNAELDFIDEDISFASKEAKLNVLGQVQARAERLVRDAERFEILKGGLHIAIVGVPNAGKSSLMNRLLGRDRSIVSEVAGTTRDYIEAEVEIAGVNIRLFDTAGLRTDAGDAIEQIGIERTRELMHRAHLCVLLVDGSAPRTESAFNEADSLEASKIFVLNKADILHPSWQKDGNAENPLLRISARTGEGIEALHAAIAAFIEARTPPDALPLGSWQRHRLQHLGQLVDRARSTMESNELPEVITHTVQAAVDVIGELTGEISSDDILGRIFSRFCIGK